MKNYFQIPLFAFAVALVLLVVGDSLAQSSSRPGGSSSRPQGSASTRPQGSSTRPQGSSSRPGSPQGSARKGSSTRTPIPGTPSGSGSRRSRSRSRQSREADFIQESAEPLSPEALEAIEQLKVIRSNITSNRKHIDQLFREMPIGYNPLQEQKQKEIDAAKAVTKELNEKLIEKGIEVFELAPLREVFSTRIVLEKLKDSLSPSTPESRFAPKTAMKISQVLLEQEKLGWPLLMLAFKASYATHNFDQASQILDRLEEVAPVKDVYYEVLEEASQAWQDELVTRRQETTTGDLPYAIVETTEGKFIIELFENQAKQTVYDFVSRAESGFYDGLPFHLVRPGSFSRVGWSRKTRAPANDTIASEAKKEKARKHFAGSVSMVSADGQTTSSVFQISHQPNLDFNGRHTVFGRVTDFAETNDKESGSEAVVQNALDTVYRLKTIDASRFNANLTQASRIIKVTIENKRNHDYKVVETAATDIPAPSDLQQTIEGGNTGEDATSFDLLPQVGTQN